MTRPPRLTRFQRLAQRAFLAYGRASRGMTLGVRAMLLTDREVLLVKHTYVPGWYLPGGGVEAGETAMDALLREVREEAGAALTGPAKLFGFYRNAHASPRDHVALYVCRQWRQDAPKAPDREIAACDLFPLDCLPGDTTRGTRARIAEVLEGREPAADW